MQVLNVFTYLYDLSNHFVTRIDRLVMGQCGN
jgi:hypothetical protein